MRLTWACGNRILKGDSPDEISLTVSKAKDTVRTMIIQPVRIMEMASEEPGKNVVVSIYRLPINQQFTIRYFSDNGLEKTETKDTTGEERPVYWSHTAYLIDDVPQVQVVITDSAPSPANARFFIPPVK